MKKSTLILSSLLCSLMLSGCGGSGSSTVVVPQPSEPSTPTPDPEPTFEQKLAAIEGISVMEINPRNDQFSKSYQIEVTQPIDHNDESVGTFTQRIYLHHAGVDLPMVLNTRGYHGSSGIQELTYLTGANQITVTHRYFDHAMPEPKDWQYLSVEQASDDLHAIYELFKPLYQKKWVSTGTSKGGMTALFYEYAYPDDMDAVVAYVAPVMLAREDQRFDEFIFETVSDEACRQKISDFQRLVLSNKEQVLEVINPDPGAFDFPLSRVLEYSVVEYPFAFWQYAPNDCATIPGAEATAAQLAQHLFEQSPLDYFSRYFSEAYKSFYVQAYNELGYYGYKTEHLADLLDSTDHSPMDFTPDDSKRNYTPTKMQDIADWLTNSGENIIYIYGGVDPYTATGITPNEDLNSFSIVQPGASHGVRIYQLDEKAKIHEALESWLDITISSGQKRQARKAPVDIESLRTPL